MRIAILSRNTNLYSTRRLIEAAKERGHEVIVLDTLRCYMNSSSDKPSIHYKGTDIVGIDAVIMGSLRLREQIKSGRNVV